MAADPQYCDSNGLTLAVLAGSTITNIARADSTGRELDEDGNFVPALGSKAIDFKEYHYSKDAPRIYNLPGTSEQRK